MDLTDDQKETLRGLKRQFFDTDWQVQSEFVRFLTGRNVRKANRSIYAEVTINAFACMIAIFALHHFGLL